ncbi:pathogenicity island protein [Staphylococcus pseudintermedius]|uniref:pathogenicity island protein n=1 Tax=Staphylococcus pseudintermedius TaxID=283734 RepID=UPI002B47C376|nr:pathogenicity island protein [Staphylococcus pseudintermedius]EIQ4141111.1 pathogenicity island protein [Staphylococcus pseudintermedius]EIQ4142342.1 pathogenicity island protein [Staphylococcus pseudintermedius]MCE5464879.1 pathogenicity island protein [Staphylococcus pseudintermedius]MCE5498809.1 pathogenicity island protein [Staphylococcus pseudintermedius]MCE5732467.1 pathogenicity island protein [Staphylococcus pseudintermedius]
MELKQKNHLHKVAEAIEKTIHIKSNSIFYEQALKMFHKELFNIVAHLNFDSEEYKIINEVVQTLHDVIHETQDIYHYSIIDDKGEHKHTTDRKGHIVGILEWALDYIIGNIEVEE